MTDHPSDQPELVSFRCLCQDDATRKNVEIQDMDFCVKCHEEIRPALKMTSNATNCNVALQFRHREECYFGEFAINVSTHSKG